MTRKLFTALTCALVLGLAQSAYAGSTTLQALLDGDSITTGGITFSDFGFVQNVGSIAPSDITVNYGGTWLKFIGAFNVSNGAEYDADLSFKATSAYGITGASLESTAAVFGEASVFIAEDVDPGLASLLNLFNAGSTIDSDSAVFLNTEEIFVNKDISLASFGGQPTTAFVDDNGSAAALSDFTQKFTTGVPTPSAALAGMALIGGLALRRRQTA